MKLKWMYSLRLVEEYRQANDQLYIFVRQFRMKRFLADGLGGVMLSNGPRDHTNYLHLSSFCRQIENPKPEALEELRNMLASLMNTDE